MVRREIAEQARIQLLHAAIRVKEDPREEGVNQGSALAGCGSKKFIDKGVFGSAQLCEGQAGLAKKRVRICPPAVRGGKDQWRGAPHRMMNRDNIA